jgi:hypothetical protein
MWHVQTSHDLQIALMSEMMRTSNSKVETNLEALMQQLHGNMLPGAADAAANIEEAEALAMARNGEPEEELKDATRQRGASPAERRTQQWIDSLHASLVEDEI